MVRRQSRQAFCLFGLVTVLGILLIWIAPCLADTKTLFYSWPSNVGPLNPHLYSPNQMFAQAMVYEPLVRYGEGGRIMPWLAESWEISKDGKEYVFKLRQGVLFSDGTPFNAQAVKKNFDAIMANVKRHDWLNIARDIHETFALDDRTFKLVLKHSYYPTLQDLTLIRPFRFLSPSAFPESGNTAEGIRKPVGTGPWMLAGAVVVETLFAWPGIGRYAVTAIYNRDFPVMQCFVLLMTVIFVFCNLFVDILYAWLDPRIRMQGENRA